MTTSAKKLLLVLGALSGLCAPASSQSLRSIRAQEAEEEALQREIAYTNSVCGTSISARIEWASAASWPEEASIAEACGGALSALEAICRSADGPSRASKIASFSCAGDASGPALRGRTLRYGASPGADGYSETRALLEGAL